MKNKNKYHSQNKAYRNAIQIEPQNTDALYNLGTLLMDQKQPKEALVFFKKAKEINSKNIKVHLNIGICYVRLKQSDHAKQYFDTVLRLDENHPTAHIELAKYWKQKTIYNKALYHAQKAAQYEVTPHNKAKYYNEIGYIHLKSSLHDKALQAFLTAKELQPYNINTLKNLIKVYAQKKQWQEAIDYSLILIKIDKKAYEYYENAGKMYLKLGERQKAKKMFNTLLQKKPTYKNKQEIISILRDL